MKSIGIARKVDQLGRIVLPAELRRLFNISEGDLVDISVDGEHILLSKVESRCVICGSTSDLKAFQNKQACIDCRRSLCD